MGRSYAIGVVALSGGVAGGGGGSPPASAGRRWINQLPNFSQFRGGATASVSQEVNTRIKAIDEKNKAYVYLYDKNI